MNKTITACYQQAQAYNQAMLSGRLVLNDAVFPHWISGSTCFWYQRETRDKRKKRPGNRWGEGKEFRLVDASVPSNMPAFDHAALANALISACGQATEQNCDAWSLPITQLSLSLSPWQLRFQAFGEHWLFDAETQSCQMVEAPPIEAGLESPNGKKVAFVRDHNLWLRDLETGTERALTKAGSQDQAYASALSGATTVEALWSPDSQRLLSHQLDVRHVLNTPMIQQVPKDGSVRPQCHEQKIAYAGDEHLESCRMLSIDVDTCDIQEAHYDPLLLSHYHGLGNIYQQAFAWWSNDNRHAFFVDVARGAKAVRVLEFDTQTGATRQVMEEFSKTFVKLSHAILTEAPVFRPLPGSNELIWFSERSGWAHLYLYDLNTGACKHPITQGEWLVRDILHVDSERRELIIQTGGRDPENNPYYRDICRVNIDTGELSSLATGPYDHEVYQAGSTLVQVRGLLQIDSAGACGLSPEGGYLVTTRSRVDAAPVSELIDRKGKTLLTIETADISALPSDWEWPLPVKVKAADGDTDLYGVIYRPPGFSPEKNYPVLDLSSGHPGFSYIAQGSFANAVTAGCYLDPLAYTALGFVVVLLEGRGTPFRHKAFQDHSYGRMASAGDLTDRIAGIRQLAERFPYMDIDRVGLAGCDGINGPVYGLLEHPDFYTVAVVFCLLDARFYRANLSEIFEGLNGENTAKPHAEELVEALTGKLLLIHGMLDDFTPVTATLRLIDALQTANKDFEALLLPNEGHSIPAYALRRSWDFLVTHLQNLEPPEAFRLTTGWDRVMGRVTEEEEGEYED